MKPITPELRKKVESLVEKPFVAITQINDINVLLFESRISIDATRTLRSIALSNLTQGAFIVDQGTQDEAVYTFKLSYWPQNPENSENLYEIAIITIDFSAEPFAENTEVPLATNDYNQLAIVFLKKLRSCILEAIAESLKTSSELALPHRNKTKSYPDQLHKNTVVNYPTHSEPDVVTNKRFLSSNVSQWIGTIAAALVIGIALATIVAMMFSGSVSVSDTKQVQQNDALPTNTTNLSELEQLKNLSTLLMDSPEFKKAAAANLSQQNPQQPMDLNVEFDLPKVKLDETAFKSPDIDKILTTNITEETLKAMGLDPGRAKANLGCLVQ